MSLIFFAGFLPFTRKKGKWYVLLGEETDGFGPFGGSREEADKSYEETAIREAREESYGVFHEEDLKNGINAGILFEDGGAKIYTMKTDWKIARILNSVYRYQIEHAIPNQVIEKFRAKWIRLDLLLEGRFGSDLRGPKGVFQKCLNKHKDKITEHFERHF